MKRIPCPECRKQGRDHKGDNLVPYKEGYICFACGHKQGFSNSSKHKSKVEVIDMDLVPFEAQTYKSLTARGISKSVCEKFLYGQTTIKHKTVHVENYPDKKGKIIAQHFRDKDKNFTWAGNFKKARLFGQHLWTPNKKISITITEGAIDCMSLAEIHDCKYPVVSLTSGVGNAVNDIKSNLEWLQGFKEIVLCFDSDEAGQECVETVAPLLMPCQVRTMVVPGFKDVNEALVAGEVKSVTNAFFNAQKYIATAIVSGISLKDKALEARERGVSLQFPKLDEALMGLRPKEIITICAGSGLGKSTLAHEILAHVHQVHKWPIGLICLEEAVAETARRHVGIYMNKPLNRPGTSIDEAEFKEAFDLTVGRGDWWAYDHFGSQKPDEIISKMRFMAKGLDCKVILLDHVSMIVSGLDEEKESERKTLDIFMTKLRAMVEETGVPVINVSHLRRPNNGKSWNEGRAINLADLRGSAGIEQLSDVVISLEGDQSGLDKNLRTIHVLKNRNAQCIGIMDRCEYDVVTGRLMPISQEYFSKQGTQTEEAF